MRTGPKSRRRLPSGWRTLGRTLLSAALLAFSPAVAAGEPARGSARGGLAWILAEELDLTGTLAAEIDLVERTPDRFLVGVDTRTAIERTLDDFTFSVRDVSVDARLAWLRRAPTGVWGLSAGRRLTETVDAEGRRGVWFLAGSWETAGFRDPVPTEGWSARLDAGAVLDSSGVDSDALASGQVRWSRRLAHSSVGFDLKVDSSWDGASPEADLELGPRLDFAAGPGRGVSFFARWLRGRHPLGLRLDGVVAGFEIVEHPARIDPGPADADLLGLAAAGVAKGGHGFGRLLLRAASPSFLREVRAVAEVDANVLDSVESGDLWYRYHVGFEMPLGPGRIAAGIHHRSNHVISGANPVGVASLNVVEVGYDSPAWERVPETSASSWGGLDWRLRAGWLVDSSFGEDVAWHARGGLRWSWPLPGRHWAPFVAFELEDGDVASRRASAGCLRVDDGLEVRLEWARDEQWFDERRTTIASIVARY